MPTSKSPAMDVYVGGEELVDDDEYESTPESRGDILDSEATTVVDEATPDEADTKPDTPAADASKEGEEQPDGMQDSGEVVDPDVQPESEVAETDEEEPTAVEDTENRIPKSRFNQVNERMKAAELRAKRLEEELKSAQGETGDVEAFDFDAKEKEYMEAVIDGEQDKALTIRAEIRRAEQAQYTSANAKASAKTVEITRAQLEFDDEVAVWAGKHPEFNPDSDVYSQDLVDEVIDLQAGFTAKGYSPAAALRKAASYVVKFNDMAEPGAKVVKDEAPAPKPEPKPTDVKAKVTAANAQPPKIDKSTGQADTGEKSVMDMTEEEYDALPESKKKQLRGDLF